MRLLSLFVGTLFLAFVVNYANAQTCNGSLGDPVINETFGAGTAAGTALPTGVTTMSFSTNPCPQDGFYTIVNSVNVNNLCHTSWQNVVHDHTGNPNGYMMLINASFSPDVFYVQQAHGLCPGTTYEFAAWVLNLIKTSFAYGTSQPDITFSVETTTGTVLASKRTGPMATTDTATWVQYGTYFTTPANVTDVVVRMINNAPGGNGNDLILDDITFRPCGPILAAGIGTATGNVLQPICAGNNANYTLKASYTSGLNSPAFQWQSNVNGAGWNDLPGQTTNTLNLTFTNATAGIYLYRFGAAESANINSSACRSYSNQIQIDVNPLPVLTVPSALSVCEGSTVTLTASGTGTIQWTGPNLPATTQNSITLNNVTFAAGGTYTATATSPQNCTVTATTSLTVNPKVTATVSSNATICDGQSTLLSAGGGVKYLWSPARGLSDTTSATPTASPTDTTTYAVKVSNASGCFDIKYVTVNVLKKPVADAGGKKTIFEGQSVLLNATAKGDISSVYWTPTTGLDNPNSLTPTAQPLKDITYTLHILSANGCGSDTSSAFVRVYNKIVIPNTFSPNEDGINDLWNIDALTTYPDCLVNVFNRYGQQVFKSTGYSTPWNGTYNGLAIPVGTYYYVIDLKNGTPKLSGWILLVR